MHPRLFEIPLPFEIGGVETLTVYSFGAMVALAAFVAGWLTKLELDRMHRIGRLSSVRIPVEDDRRRGGRKTREASPGVLVSNMVILAVVVGLIGAKIFHALENPAAFSRDPLGLLFASGGFTFYGGLILAALALAWYIRSKGLSIRHVADAVAPGLMIGYGIGRIGCHLAGDGDWGIASNISAKPDWLPMWLWAEDYSQAIIGPPPVPVYPTSIYEFVAACLLFGLLWSVRKHPYMGGWLFSLYLLVNGIERFLIEQIRVNNEFAFLGMQVTQAEGIAVALVVLGIAGLVYTSRHRREHEASDPRAAQPA